MEGYKDILSITVSANESRKFWLGMMKNLTKQVFRPRKIPVGSHRYYKKLKFTHFT
ncbi:hypothetical protein GCM10008910_24320 [Faecalicatena orotica]